MILIRLVPAFNNTKFIELLRQKIKIMTNLDAENYTLQELTRITYITPNISCSYDEYDLIIKNSRLYYTDNDTIVNGCIPCNGEISQVVSNAQGILILKSNGKAYFCHDLINMVADISNFDNKYCELLYDIIQIESDINGILLITKKGEIYHYGLQNIVSVSVSLDFKFALDIHGQDPIVIPNLKYVVQISSSKNISLFLTKYGDVYGYGHNESNKIPRSINEIAITTPTLITGLPKISKVHAINHYSLFLTIDGKFYQFKRNQSSPGLIDEKPHCLLQYDKLIFD